MAVRTMLNGFAIIAHVPDERLGSGYVILAARNASLTEQSPRYDYVTARMARLNDAEWVWGHYFNGVDSLPVAFEDMKERASAH